MITCNRAENLSTLSGAKPIPARDGKIFWHLDESQLPNLEKDKIIIAFNKAFGIIQPHFNGTIFESSKNIDSQIVIRFRNNVDKDLPTPFGKNVLAYAYPFRENFDFAGDLFMNLAVNWKEKHEKGGYSLVKVLVHELFHCFGFDHSKNPQSVNYWQYIENDEIVITQDDIDSIRAFYGFKYDLEFLKLWIKTSDFLHLLNSRMIVKLGQLIGINLDPNQQKIHNIKLIKNKLGI